MANKGNSPRISLPLDTLDLDFLTQALQTAVRMIEKTQVGPFLTQLNIYREVKDGSDTDRMVKATVYKFYLRLPGFSDEQWVEVVATQDGRYWWKDNDSPYGTGREEEGDPDLTLDWDRQQIIVSEALSRILKERASRLQAKVRIEKEQVSQASAAADTLTTVASSLPRTPLTNIGE